MTLDPHQIALDDLARGRVGDETQRIDELVTGRGPVDWLTVAQRANAISTTALERLAAERAGA